MSRKLTFLPLILAAATNAAAVQIASEPFSTEPAAYTTGTTNLIGQGPANTAFSGNWLPAYGGAQSPDVIETSLTYPDLTSTGGSVIYTADGGRTGRILSSPYTDTSTGSLYISTLIQIEEPFTGYRAFELHTGGFDDGSNRRFQLAIGETASGAIADTDIALRINNDDATGTSLGAIDSAVNLFIIKIDFSDTPNSDTITVFRNPTDLTVEANNTPTATVTGFDFNFDRASFARFGSPSAIAFDELRIGTTFNDVTGTVNPDADGDGMDDGWEFLNMVDDPAGDALLDNDGLTNLEEFLAKTDPNKADTDDDNIDDKPELEGSANPFNNEKTDPTNSDSDGDSILDGAEISSDNGFITNPNLADTDVDGEDDALEIAEGTDPTDPTNNSAALGNFIIDGQRDSLYPAPLAVQTIETGFGDNQNELNAAYATVKDGNLYLLLTGNIQDNFNKLEILIDSRTGGSETFTSAGNDNAGAMDGLIFDAGFAPDYHLIARRGSDKFDLDFADLQASQFAFYSEIFPTGSEGRVTLGAPTNSTLSTDPAGIRIGYNNSNTAGIGGTTGNDADQAAATAVITGLELCIPLAAISATSDELRISAFINNSEHDFISNQFLPGLPSGSGNLAEASTVDLTTQAEDQFLTVELPTPDSQIIAFDFDDTTGEYTITFTSEETKVYKIESSTDLKSPWFELEEDYSPDPGETTTYTNTETAPLPKRKYYRITPLAPLP